MPSKKNKERVTNTVKNVSRKAAEFFFGRDALSDGLTMPVCIVLAILGAAALGNFLAEPLFGPGTKEVGTVAPAVLLWALIRGSQLIV